MVSPASFRHPSVLAKLATTADHVSDGRFELGLGAGWHEREHAAYGFPYHDLPTRMEVFAEQLQIVLGHWAPAEDGPFSFGGKHYQLEQLDAQPKPIQQPHPPLLMGGAAGPVAARLAASYADEYNTTAFTSVQQVQERRERIDNACAAVGRDPIPFSVMTPVIAGIDEADLQARARRAAVYSGIEPDVLLGAPPEGWIVGTLDQVTEQLHALADAGVSRVLCQHLPHDDLEFVELLGRELAPRLV
jgi:alkanesulfonate monooxygenase SsuD/methylene tetrahydromethanopterin reductase-like flavin-dependent oxidoreductase (luciferase family)